MKIRFLFLIIIGVSLAQCNLSDDKQKPNIILISVDDMGWSDLGCYGSEIQTPNIDLLANNGLRFSNFYNTSKCFPSRASLITGLYARDCGYDRTFTNPLKSAVTLGEVLQTAGYRTYWSGKHHGFDNPYDRGFDHYFGLKDGACNHFNPGLQRDGEADPARKRSNREWRIDSLIFHPYTPEQKDFYTTDYFTNHALEYIQEANDMQLPFFLYLAITAPHDPLMAWPEDIDKYRGSYDQGYEPVRKARYQKQKGMALVDERFVLSDKQYQIWDSLSPEIRELEAQKMEIYAAMIDRVDQNIGRVVDQLKTLEIFENTLIMFVSDNGASSEMVRLKTDDDSATPGSMGRWLSLGKSWANVANTPYRFYKNFSYEGGINTPMIAHWPKHIEANTFSDFPGHLGAKCLYRINTDHNNSDSQ